MLTFFTDVTPVNDYADKNTVNGLKRVTFLYRLRKSAKAMNYSMDSLYARTGFDISRIITRNYSTSFFSAVNLLGKDIRKPIFGIYGFVRLADEIVDSLTEYDRERLWEGFEATYAEAARYGVSTNPVVNAFELTVRKYRIERPLVEAFLSSMRSDLTHPGSVTKSEAEAYIYGSASAVGLMCLRVFTQGNNELYEQLRQPAMKLGSAFQKVNFLRDLRTDLDVLKRSYFPELDRQNFNEEYKRQIIAEIETEFAEAYRGIRLLPPNSRLGVAIAYIYYNKLLQKIKKTPAHKLITRRIRIPDISKAILLSRSLLLNKINLI